MNGYELTAESYKHLMEQGKIDKEWGLKNIKIFEMVGKLTEEEICLLFDTGAFNEIVKGYVSRALDEAKVGEENHAKVMEELRWLFDTTGAEDML